MRLLTGISGGMVMQRGADGCDILFAAEVSGELRSSMGRVEKAESGFP